MSRTLLVVLILSFFSMTGYSTAGDVPNQTDADADATNQDQDSPVNPIVLVIHNADTAETSLRLIPSEEPGTSARVGSQGYINPSFEEDYQRSHSKSEEDDLKLGASASQMGSGSSLSVFGGIVNPSIISSTRNMENRDVAHVVISRTVVFAMGSTVLSDPISNLGYHAIAGHIIPAGHMVGLLYGMHNCGRKMNSEPAPSGVCSCLRLPCIYLYRAVQAISSRLPDWLTHYGRPLLIGGFTVGAYATSIADWLIHYHEAGILTNPYIPVAASPVIIFFGVIGGSVVSFILVRRSMRSLQN